MCSASSRDGNSSQHQSSSSPQLRYIMAAPPIAGSSSTSSAQFTVFSDALLGDYNQCVPNWMLPELSTDEIGIGEGGDSAGWPQYIKDLLPLPMKELLPAASDTGMLLPTMTGANPHDSLPSAASTTEDDFSSIISMPSHNNCDGKGATSSISSQRPLCLQSYQQKDNNSNHNNSSPSTPLLCEVDRDCSWQQENNSGPAKNNYRGRTANNGGEPESASSGYRQSPSHETPPRTYSNEMLSVHQQSDLSNANLLDKKQTRPICNATTTTTSPVMNLHMAQSNGCSNVIYPGSSDTLRLGCGLGEDSENSTSTTTGQLPMYVNRTHPPNRSMTPMVHPMLTHRSDSSTARSGDPVGVNGRNMSHYNNNNNNTNQNREHHPVQYMNHDAQQRHTNYRPTILSGGHHAHLNGTGGPAAPTVSGTVPPSGRGLSFMTGTPESEMFTRVPLGEKGRMELKTAIRAAIKDRPELRERVNAVAKLRCATIPQLLKIASICDLWYLALNISRRFMEIRNGKQGGRGGRKSGGNSSGNSMVGIVSSQSANGQQLNGIKSGVGNCSPTGRNYGVPSAAAIFGDHRMMYSATANNSASQSRIPSNMLSYSNSRTGSSPSPSSVSRKRRTSVVKTGAKGCNMSSSSSSGGRIYPAGGNCCTGGNTAEAASTLYNMNGNGVSSASAAAAAAAAMKPSFSDAFFLSPLVNSRNAMPYGYSSDDPNNLTQSPSPPYQFNTPPPGFDQLSGGLNSAISSPGQTDGTSSAGMSSFEGVYFSGDTSSVLRQQPLPTSYHPSDQQQQMLQLCSRNDNYQIHHDTQLTGWMNQNNGQLDNAYLRSTTGTANDAAASIFGEAVGSWGILGGEEPENDERGDERFKHLWSS